MNKRITLIIIAYILGTIGAIITIDKYGWEMLVALLLLIWGNNMIESLKNE